MSIFLAVALGLGWLDFDRQAIPRERGGAFKQGKAGPPKSESVPIIPRQSACKNYIIESLQLCSVQSMTDLKPERSRLSGGHVFSSNAVLVIYREMYAGDEKRHVSNVQKTGGAQAVIRKQQIQIRFAIQKEKNVCSCRYVRSGGNAGRFHAIFSVPSGFAGKPSGGNRCTHSDSTKYQSLPSYGSLPFSGTSTIKGCVRSLPLSAQIAVAAILAIGATGVFGLGFWRLWSGNSLRRGLGRFAASVALCGGLGVAYALWCDLAFVGPN